MPRLGLSINESFDRRPRAPQPDAYGRRPRQLSGVQIVGERDRTPVLSSLYLKTLAALGLLATVSVSLAILRIYTFHH